MVLGFGVQRGRVSFFGLCCSECRSPKEDPSLYPEAKGVLNALRQKGVTMAVASRTPTPDIARCFLNKLNITDYFVNMVSMRCLLRSSFTILDDLLWRCLSRNVTL